MANHSFHWILGGLGRVSEFDRSDLIDFFIVVLVVAVMSQTRLRKCCLLRLFVFWVAHLEPDCLRLFFFYTHTHIYIGNRLKEMPITCVEASQVYTQALTTSVRMSTSCHSTSLIPSTL